MGHIQPRQHAADSYKGSPVQRPLTLLPEDMFQGSGQQFHTLGFEYWTEPSDPTGASSSHGDGPQTARLGASDVGPYTDPTVGSGMGQ